MKKLLYLISVVLLSSSCVKDMMTEVNKGEWNHERNIVEITFENQIGMSTITRTAEEAIIDFNYNFDATGKEQIPLTAIVVSYGASVNVASGDVIDFGNADNTAVVTVTSAKGESLEWTIRMHKFTEPLAGKWNIKTLSVYGGTGPVYGGAGYNDLNNNLAEKCFGKENNPSHEMDNIIEFKLTGYNDLGNSYGTVTNDAGADGKYADFQFSDNGLTADCNKFYRQIPIDGAEWEHDMAQNTIIIKYKDGSQTISKFTEPGYTYTPWAGGAGPKVFENRTLEFDLTNISQDDWGHIYSYYDQVAARPYFFWLEMTPAE